MTRFSDGKRFGPRAAVGAVALIAIALTGGALGPDLIGYYRFSRAISANSAAEEAAGGPWPQLHAVCMPCHGVQGNSVNAIYPRLAAQPALYLVRQLQDFASGHRDNPAMASLARNLSGEEIRRLASYFAAQPLVPHEEHAASSAPYTEGRSLVQSAGCAACHGEKLQGRGEFPRLAGQSPRYLVDQLKRYRSGERDDRTDSMQRISADLSDTDIEAIAHFLASYRGE